MTPKIFDTHSHLNFPQFDKDREEVIKRMRENGIWTICVGTDKKISREAVELAELDTEGGIFTAVGLHPTDSNEDFDMDYYRQLASHPKVVAIGECGLDFFRVKDRAEQAEQKELFKKHIELAVELNKPLIIHCRDAHKETIDILSAYAARGLKGVIHFFSGNWEEAQKYFDWGFNVSFAGPITFTDEYDEVIRKSPLEKIMAETDSPFVAPAPHRGKRNEPSFVTEIIKKIAQVREISYEEVTTTTTQNAIKMFIPHVNLAG